jgi:hypothetical protein
MKLKKEGMKMKGKWKFFVIILLFACLIAIGMPEKPKLISNITTLDTSYLTILVDVREIRNREKLEEKILKMCREDTFDSIKLWTDDRERTSRWNISVYSSKRELEEGNAAMIIKYQEGE